MGIFARALTSLRLIFVSFQVNLQSPEAMQCIRASFSLTSRCAIRMQVRSFPVVSEAEFSRQVGLNEADKSASLAQLGSSDGRSSAGYSRKAAASLERIFGKKG